MEIKLDVAALNALFPEGSTARVELERAVIASVTNKIGSKTLHSIVRQEIEKIQDVTNVRKEVQRLMSEFFEPKDRYTRELALTPEQKKAVCTDVHHIYREMVREVLNECVDTYSSSSMYNDMKQRLMYVFDQKIVPHMTAELKSATSLYTRGLAEIGLAELQQYRTAKVEQDQKNQEQN